MSLLETSAIDPSFWANLASKEGLSLTIIAFIIFAFTGFMWVVVRPVVVKGGNTFISFLKSLTHKLDRIEDNTDEIKDKVNSIHRKVVGG
jgi:predicted PurR-regulated permease PerM